MRKKNIEHKKYIGYTISRQTKKCVHRNVAKALEFVSLGLLLRLRKINPIMEKCFPLKYF